MFALTHKLLNGSGVTAATHPLLVSLLELGAQPSTAKGGKPGAENARLCRQWKTVCRAFQRCREFHLTDEDLRKAMPFPGLSFSEERGWRITAPDLLQYRALVATALSIAADAKGGTLHACTIETLDDLRAAMKENRIRELEAPPLDRGKVETSLLPGGRVVVSFPIYGRRVFSLLQADSVGRVHALSHEKTKRAAVAAATIPGK